jgi:hypothetical protein
MDEDTWDDLHGDVHDLDGGWCDATGNPAEDIAGYESPSRRGQNLSGFTSSGGDWLARSREGRQQRRARRAAVEANLAETRQRREARRREAAGESGNMPNSPLVEPAGELCSRHNSPPPHIAAAVERGAVGRAAGWYRVDIKPDGSAQWRPVDQPGDGPWITATTPAPQPPALQPVQPQPAPRRWWRRRRPAEPQPSPGTRIW